MHYPKILYVLRPYAYFAMAILGFSTGKIFPILCGMLLFTVGLRILQMRYHAKQTWKFD